MAKPIGPRGRLTYRAVWQVDDHLEPERAEAVAKRLGPPACSAAIDTAMVRLLADWPLATRPSLGAVSVVARTLDSAPLDPDGPFATPDGQALLAGFLADLLAWDHKARFDQRMPWELMKRAQALLAGLTAADAAALARRAPGLAPPADGLDPNPNPEANPASYPGGEP